MRPKVFVAQPAVEAALKILRETADVAVYPYLDRQITAEELAANARRADWLMLVSDNIVTKEIIESAPGLKGIHGLHPRPLYRHRGRHRPQGRGRHIRPGGTRRRGCQYRRAWWRQPGYRRSDNGNAGRP